MKQKKKNTKEIVLYVISGTFWLFGLSLLVTGLVGSYLPGLERNNPVVQAENSLASWSGIPLNFLSWGLIFLALATAALIAVLLVYARKVELERDRASKRAQRLGSTDAE